MEVGDKHTVHMEEWKRQEGGLMVMDRKKWTWKVK